MAKVTSKLQLTVPKAIAEQYAIRPGDDLDWLPAGDVIRVRKRDLHEAEEPATITERLLLFDQATNRQHAREARSRKKSKVSARERGWTREELYQRGISR